MAAEAQRGVYAFKQWEVDLARRELRENGVAVRIGGRAFEIVVVLVQSAGRVVTKEDLMARVWPGAVVEDNTLQVHISAIRKALAADRMLLKAASGRGYRLLGDWAVRSEAAPVEAARVPQAAPSIESNLPLAAPNLIGRSTAVQRLCDLMSAYRLVTLTGPGGIGKTRLALQVAHNLRHAFDNDVWLVELAPLADPALVGSMVARVLGLVLGQHQVGPEAIARAIGGRKLLLLLDNCEHIIDEAARLVDAMMRICPNASVIATSRELLRIDGEYIYRVPPLDVPPADLTGTDDVLEHSAVQLFVARTQLLNPGYAPRDGDLRAIGSICRRLDGLPLAIEFAAARAVTLGVGQVLSGLDDRFGLLTGGRRTALPRHHTLRALLDWSHDLLTEVERMIMRRLAVFNGGFTLRAACAVLAIPDLSSQDIVDGIGSLVTKSLVAVETSSEPTRYLLLETIRAYALEKLTEAAELGFRRRCHAEHFRDMFEQAEAEWRSRPIDEWVTAYGHEIDNVQAALDWAFSSDGDATIAITLSASSVRLLFDLSLIGESRRRAEQALALMQAGVQVDARREMHLRAAQQATRVYTDGPSTAVRDAWERVLEIALQLDDVDYQTRALWGLWNDNTYGGFPAESLIFATQYADHAAASGEAWRVTLARRVLGISLHYCGDQAAARSHLEHVLADYVHGVARAALGSRLNHATVTRATLARVLWLQGKPDQALRMTEEALQTAIADDHPQSILYLLVEAALPVSFLTGDLVATQKFLRSLLEQTSRSGFRIWLTYGGCFRAMLRVAEDAPAGLPELVDAIQALRDSGFCEHLTMFLGILAEAQVDAGQVSQAMLTVDNALDWCEQHGERWCLGELLRIKGEVLACQGAGSDPAVHFEQALALSREQGALSWELRTASSFARLRRRQDRNTEARTLLASVYDRFTEGYETADLRAAALLLRELSTAPT